jgi:hypothetical protein
MTQRTAVTFRASPEVLAAIDAHANAEFCKRGEAVAAILESAVAQSTGAAPSPMADMKQQSVAVDLEMKQMRLQQLRKNLITVDEACRVVQGVFGEMKTEGVTLMEDVARQNNLDAEDLKRRFLECMAGPTTVRREPYQQLADDFSREPLP